MVDLLAVPLFGPFQYLHHGGALGDDVSFQSAFPAHTAFVAVELESGLTGQAIIEQPRVGIVQLAQRPNLEGQGLRLSARLASGAMAVVCADRPVGPWVEAALRDVHNLLLHDVHLGQQFSDMNAMAEPIPTSLLGEEPSVAFRTVSAMTVSSSTVATVASRWT